MRDSGAVRQASNGDHDTFSRHGHETRSTTLLDCKVGSCQQAVILRDSPQDLPISPRQLYTAPSTESKGSCNFEVSHRQASNGLNRQPVVRFADGAGMSPVDDKWGILVDGKGLPTSRLSQVLQGLAKYMVS